MAHAHATNPAPNHGHTGPNHEAAVGHDHIHAPKAYDRRFAAGIALNLLIVVAQVILGLISGSLALVADAGHNLSDVLALVLAWGAAVLSRREPSGKRTYGWRRITILAAFVNGSSVLVVTVLVGWEALHRLFEPATVQPVVMIVAAIGAAIVNAIVALMFRSGHDDLNVRGAFLHMAADAAVSLGVAIAGVAIIATGWVRLDAIVSLAIGLVIVYTGWFLMRDAANLILDAVPVGIDVGAIRSYLSDLPEVSEVHDLHVWGMSTTEVALTAHLVTNQQPPYDRLLAQICEALDDEFGVEHVTIQLEGGDPDYPCVLAATHRV